MTVPEQINDLITQRRPARLCDRCISNAVGLINKSAHSAQVTSALGTTSDFTRERGVCSNCKREKTVIRAK